MCIKYDHDHLEKSTCCCGCSLFTATMLIGVLELFNVFSSCLQRNWLATSLSVVQCIFFILVAVDKQSVFYRKMLYYVYLTLSIAFTISFAAAILVLALSDLADPQFEQVCKDNDDLYPGKYTELPDCVSFLNKVAISFMTFLFLIFVPLRFLLCHVLKIGYRGQRAAHERS